MTRLLFFICLCLYACGQEDGPGIPEPLTPLSEKPGAAAGKAINPETGADAGAADPRLTSLPDFLRIQVLACEAGSHFYDLGSQTCTTTAPAPFPCTIDQALRDRLDPSTQDPLNDYLTNKAIDLVLYSCTVDEKNISLHFFKFEAGVVQYRKLNVAKKL